jgi:hypothetical protein
MRPGVQTPKLQKVPRTVTTPCQSYRQLPNPALQRTGCARPLNAISSHWLLVDHREAIWQASSCAEACGTSALAIVKAARREDHNNVRKLPSRSFSPIVSRLLGRAFVV